MQVKTVEVAGIFAALHAMRNPMNSWDKSDSHNGYVGPNDKKLAKSLIMSGTEHAKFMLRGNEDYPLCPDCMHSADRITKARFNLIKYFRLKRSRKTVPRKREPEEEFVPGTNIPRIKPKRGY